MKFIPTLFSTVMVQAILECRKTQTRRTFSDKLIINNDPERYKFHGIDETGSALFKDLKPEITPWISPIKCPYGQPGDILWVRETYMKRPNGQFNVYGQDIGLYIHKASASKQFIGEWPGYWKPSIHMPKAACRIWLQVKSVRVERLQEISMEDAISEGIGRSVLDTKFKKITTYTDYLDTEHYFQRPDYSFMTLWQSINGKESWEANPWVWVIEFERLEKMPQGFLS